MVAILGWALFLLTLLTAWRVSKHPRVRDNPAWRAYGQFETSRIVGLIVLMLIYFLIAWGLLR